MATRTRIRGMPGPVAPCDPNLDPTCSHGPGYNFHNDPTYRAYADVKYGYANTGSYSPWLYIGIAAAAVFLALAFVAKGK